MRQPHNALDSTRTVRPTAVFLIQRAGVIPVALASMMALSGSATFADEPTNPLIAPRSGEVQMTSALPNETPAEAQPARDPMKPSDKNGNQPKVTVSEQMTVDLHVKDENVTNVLEMLSIQSRKNIIASKSVSGKVSADLYNVTFGEALDSILHVNGFAYLEQGNFIYVYTAEELAKIEASLKRRAAKVFKLSYLNAQDASEFVKPMLSQGGEIKASTKSENFTISDSSPVGKDDYALGATIVVIDYEENINAIEKLIGELDTKPAQVLVEATVLQTTLSEANAFGFDFSIIADVNFNDFAGALGGPFGIVNQIRAPSAPTPGSLADNRAIALNSTAGKTDGPSTFKFGLVSDHVTLVTRLLDEVSDTTVLANPKLLTLNRQPSRVLVGQRVAYLNTTATETSSTQSVEFLDTGVQLYFRPFVSASNEIRMELKPQVSDAKTRNVGTSGGQQVTVPDEITQEVVTNVMVPDGMTVVLGGLFRETTITSRQQVPVVGDIPIIGNAFRGQDDSVRREEIIFLVTPTIMNNNVLLSQGETALNSMERVRAGTRQGLLDFSRDKMTSALNLEAERAARDGKYEDAMWKLQRSLSLNPKQADAYELRERITGERELWPSGGSFDSLISKQMQSRIRAVQPSVEPVPHRTPWRSYDVPRLGGSGGSSSVTPSENATPNAAVNTPVTNPENNAVTTPAVNPEQNAPQASATPAASATQVEHAGASASTNTAANANVNMHASASPSVDHTSATTDTTTTWVTTPQTSPTPTPIETVEITPDMQQPFEQPQNQQPAPTPTITEVQPQDQLSSASPSAFEGRTTFVTGTPVQPQAAGGAVAGSHIDPSLSALAVRTEGQDQPFASAQHDVVDARNYATGKATTFSSTPVSSESPTVAASTQVSTPTIVWSSGPVSFGYVSWPALGQVPVLVLNNAAFTSVSDPAVGK